MWWLIGIAVVCFVIVSLIMPWVNRDRINDLEKEVNQLRAQLKRIYASPQNGEAMTQPEQELATAVYEQRALDPTEPAYTSKIENHYAEQKPSSSFSFENQFGAKLPVWIGGIALALAGFFLVKYSIETGLLSPTVRVVLGIIFGFGLLYGAEYARKNETLANGTRIAQALSGAGIADLYVCIFAATTLYDLIPNFIGFAAMAAITATAVVLSLKHGAPIALLGLVGGFLTPALLGSTNPEAPMLFMYLYFVLAGLFVVIQKKDWWVLAIPCVLAAFLWVLAWVFGGHFSSGDTLWLALFLMAVSVTVIKLSKIHYESDATHTIKLLTLSSILNYATMGGALLLMGIVASKSGFEITDWALFGLLSLGSIGLAFYNPKLYGLAPWFAMAINLVMLAVWSSPDSALYASTLALFAALFIVSSIWIQFKHSKPLQWGIFACVSSLLFYLIAYFKLRYSVVFSDFSMFWGFTSLLFAGLGCVMLKHVKDTMSNEHSEKQHILAVYAASVSAFLSIGLTIELPREFLSVAFALELLAIAWIHIKIDIRALKTLAGIVAIVFGFLLIPQILLLIQLTVYSLVEAELHLQSSIPIVNWPLFQLGLPAICFCIASILLRKKNDGSLIKSLEVASIALFAVMGYYFTRNAFHVNENVLFVKAGFIERGVISNILFLYGLGCLWVGRNYLRSMVSLSGLVLCGIAIFRIFYFDFLAYNPLWSAQKVGDLPLLNALIVTYGLPIAWTWLLVKELPYVGQKKWQSYGYGLMLILGFTLTSLEVRQLFQGTYLDGEASTNAEIYSYSVAWLVFGIGLLLSGTLHHDKMQRVASLIVMILTVGKVFLFDASELEGLYRVFSFLGLGISLLGLSWFYTRFVFNSNKELAS